MERITVVKIGGNVIDNPAAMKRFLKEFAALEGPKILCLLYTSIRYMVFGNILRNGTYPISVSSERIFQAIAIIEYAKQNGADAVAHGSTGAGNDQVRFDLTFQILSLIHI